MLKCSFDSRDYRLLPFDEPIEPGSIRSLKKLLSGYSFKRQSNVPGGVQIRVGCVFATTASECFPFPVALTCPSAFGASLACVSRSHFLNKDTLFRAMALQLAEDFRIRPVIEAAGRLLPAAKVLYPFKVDLTDTLKVELVYRPVYVILPMVAAALKAFASALFACKAVGYRAEVVSVYVRLRDKAVRAREDGLLSDIDSQNFAFGNRCGIGKFEHERDRVPAYPYACFDISGSKHFVEMLVPPEGQRELYAVPYGAYRKPSVERRGVVKIDLDEPCVELRVNLSDIRFGYADLVIDPLKFTGSFELSFGGKLIDHEPPLPLFRARSADDTGSLLACRLDHPRGQPGFNLRGCLRRKKRRNLLFFPQKIHKTGNNRAVFRQEIRQTFQFAPVGKLQGRFGRLNHNGNINHIFK